ncbi:LrgB family protein [Dysgonomonas sp. Marseille-P4677]|uniref:LrgB family protein n=1 Tax=Dysgonomonas sp. Marseille-P4677 TaxID=2364790 RepID=UPI0019121534|nr:LrgB family protein [Dysgonomonas sp. Marseille-P4677]MBK5721035.1 LrgB family protein [Dysgonomonas sp. Marseille-P4677]
MKALFESTEFTLLLIFGSYLFGQWVFKKTKLGLLHPLIISIAIIIAFLEISGIDYQTFELKSQFITFMLGPSVVALGYVLYEQLAYLKGNVVSILTSIFIGSVVGIISVIILAEITGADEVIIRSLEPKSVTTPIAMSIAEQSGGNVSLTAVIVLFCGIFGSIVGPPILRILGIKSSVAKGLAMGASAHGVGTAKAMEMGMIEGALSGLAIGLMGVMTALLIPIFHQLFSSIL